MVISLLQNMHDYKNLVSSLQAIHNYVHEGCRKKQWKEWGRNGVAYRDATASKKDQLM